MISKIRALHLIFQQEQGRLILWLPVLFGVGVGIYFSLPFEPGIWWLIGGSWFCALVAAIFWRSSFFRILFIALLVVTLGMLRAETRTISVAAPVLQEEIFFRPVEGKITDIQVREKGEKLIITDVYIEGLAEDITPKRISVSLKAEQQGIAVGDMVQLRATLFPPPTPVMPGAYDFARMFYYEQLGAVGYTPKPVEIMEKASPNGFEQELNTLRLSLTARILAPMTPENGWVAAAMMVGEQSGVSKEVSEAMRGSGIYHVLSISGLHMSLAVMLVFVSVRFLLSLWPPFALRFPIKKIAAVIGLASSFAYLLLAGYPVPAVRSFIMVACVMLAIVFDRSGINVFSLAWAAAITLLWQPESLLGASFQLSFAATLGILAFYERYSHTLYRPDMGFIHKIRLYFLGIMLTSLVATIATTPLVIYHFNRFTLWGIAANMLMLPLASFWIMPAAVISFLLMPFGLEHYPLLALDYGISLMMRGARLFAGLPYASITLPPPSFWGILLTVFGGLWLCIWQRKWRLAGVPLMIIGMATIALHHPYDLLVSPDASKVALRLDNGRFIFLRGKDASFDGQAWLRTHGQETGLPLEEMEGALGSCGKHKCTVSAYGKKIVVMRGKKKTGASCDGKPDIVISQNYLGENPECRKIPLLIDKDYLQTRGATAIRFHTGDMSIENATELRGDRPWVNTSLK
jgi:competence protein ComEC